MTGKRIEQRGLYYDELETEVRYVHRPGRTLTEADVVAFAGISGDFNPLHVDEVFASDGPFGRRVVHGLLVLSVATGLRQQMGVFYGVEDERGELAAVGGTHIVDYTARIAAVGNMYTRPDCRGQGYASAVLAAIVTALQDAGVATIVLNVDQRNTAARRIYERFGFVVHCPYIEGVATAVA